MKALLFADDLGVRLRPLTAGSPVAAVKILGRPLICGVLERLARSSVTEVMLITGTMAESVLAASEECLGVGLRVLDYDPSSGGDGEAFFDALCKGALEFAEGEELLLVDCSVLEEIDYGALVLRHEALGDKGVITLSGGAAVFSDKELLIECLQKMTAEKLGAAEAARAQYPERCRELFGEFFVDIDSASSYIEANLVSLRGTSAVSETAIVSSDAKISGAVFVGDNCIIGKNAVLKDCVIGSGTVVMEGASVVNSVVLDNVKVGKGCKISDTVICEQAVLGANASCEGVILGKGVSAGAGSVFFRGVRVWPFIDIETGSVVSRSIIGGGEDDKIVFKEQGIDGKRLTRRLPAEKMTRLGCAVGNCFGQGATVVVCADNNGEAKMLASGVVAGLISSGIKVRTATGTELPVIRWVCRSGAADGGVFIDNNAELTITLLDKHGNDLPSFMRKKVQSAFVSDSFFEAEEKNMLPPEELSNPEDYYVADLGKQFPYAYRAFRLRSPEYAREKREALTAYIIGRLFPDAPIFVSETSALAAKTVAEGLGRQIIKCGDKIGDVMEAMEPFMKLPGVYCQYLMLYDDFAFELGLCHYKAVTGEDAECAADIMLHDNVIKKNKSVSCDKRRKGEILRRISKDFGERFGGNGDPSDMFSWDEKGTVRIYADEGSSALNISVESFSEEFAEDMMSRLEEIAGRAVVG